MIKLVSSSIGSITEEHFENGEKSVNKLKVVSLLVLLALTMSMLAACGSSAPAGVSNLVLSTDKDGANKAATFAPTDTVYMTADVNQVADGASFDIKWYALNVSGQDPATPFLSNNVVWSTASGANRLYAQTNSTTGGFPVGQYRVEVDMGGNKVAEAEFNIQ